MDIKDITPGQSYACRFRTVTVLDEHGQPAPNLSGAPVKGPGIYEGIGVLVQRDLENELVRLKDNWSGQEFVVSFKDIWEIDTVEWINPLDEA